MLRWAGSAGFSILHVNGQAISGCSTASKSLAVIVVMPDACVNMCALGTLYPHVSMDRQRRSVFDSRMTSPSLAPPSRKDADMCLGPVRYFAVGRSRSSVKATTFTPPPVSTA